ncbi:MAG TPA: hypothetical protein PKD80_11165 [Microthrixaceae bacterium]|jgi:hypothetical protein|nr:hypothetical protein [Microthrixaceae bacterium]HMS13654.1 hypothetical protein [Microthrixaceae bacterium]HMT25674.1 hypothetical protein [Microthrixaceae bacterium]HMT60214.1 hypothetical protein [Microthrixaceae bacterium]
MIARAARFTLATATIAAGSFGVGCSDDAPDATPTSSTTTTEPGKRITQEQAGVLADVQLKNYQAGGARITASVPYGVATFHLTGQVDYQLGAGRLTITPEATSSGTGPTGPSVDETPFDVVFGGETVLEQVPNLAALLAAANRSPANWVARPLDPTSSPLDIVISIIATASSIQRDNPVLLLSKGTTWLRSDRLADHPVDVYRLGRTVYWVGSDDGMLYRIEASLSATGSTATIDLRDHGPRTIEAPATGDVVDLSSVTDLYSAARSAGGSTTTTVK